MIGNLEKSEPPIEQYNTLVTLTRKLMVEYDIPNGKIYKRYSVKINVNNQTHFCLY